MKKNQFFGFVALTLCISLVALIACNGDDEEPIEERIPVITEENIAIEKIALPFAGKQIDFLDALVGLSTSLDGNIYKTLDGGYSWEEVYSTDYNLMHLQYLNASLAFILAVVDSQNAYLIKTEDGGVTFSESVIDLGVNHKRVHFIDNQIGFVVGGKTFLHTRDGGSSWANNLLEDGNYGDVLFHDQNRGYVVGTNNIVYRSDNGGVSWTKLFPEKEGELWHLTNIIPVKNELVLSGSGILIESKDEVEWKRTFAPHHMYFHQYATDTLFAFGRHFFQLGSIPSAVIYGTVDGGENWDTILYRGFIEIKHGDFLGKNMVYVLASSVWEGIMLWKIDFSFD